jgi:hypothetical protein
MKLKTLIFSIAMALLSFANSASAQKTDISGITSIELNLACQLVLVQGTTPNLEIVGDESALKDIETKIRNGKLIITSDRNNQRKKDVVVKIEIKDLEELHIGGAVDMKTVRKLELDNFKLSISGVGNVEMALIADNFKLNCSGVGNVEIEGKCNSMRMNVSGVGNINANEFEAKNAEVSNSGVGKVNVFVTDDLDASVSGVGSIKYLGSPSINANVSGLGRISKY